MSDYWSTVVLVAAYVSMLVAFPASVILGMCAIADNDWRTWVGANLCALIGIFTMSYVLVYG